MEVMTKDPIIQRVKQLMFAKNYKSETSFASEIGIKQKTLNAQLAGDSSISLATIMAISDRFADVSLEWLLRGNGEMFISSNDEMINIIKQGDYSSVGNSNTINHTTSEVASLIEQNAKLVATNEKLVSLLAEKM